MIPQRLGQLPSVREAELLVGAVQAVLHRAHRKMHHFGDLLVGAARGSLQRRVELGRSELGPRTNGAHERGDGAFATCEKSSGRLLRRRGVPARPVAPEVDG